MFAANLKKMRRGKGWSQRGLGFKTGIGQANLSLLEGGKRLPDVTTLEKLADALETTMDALWRGTAEVATAAKICSSRSEANGDTPSLGEGGCGRTAEESPSPGSEMCSTRMDSTEGRISPSRESSGENHD